MNHILKACWITTKSEEEKVCHLFKKSFTETKEISKATITITAMGVYKLYINSKAIEEFVLAPGFTSYQNRLQYQTYDITHLLQENNTIKVSVGDGWAIGRLGWEGKTKLFFEKPSLLACIKIDFIDGDVKHIITDESWLVGESKIRFSDIYDGEIYDNNFPQDQFANAIIVENSKENLIPQEGPYVKEFERIAAKQLIISPKDEYIIDFGQNITGYIQFKTKGEKGQTFEIYHAEVLDKDGNFYIENYRSAISKLIYISNGQEDLYKPSHTFFGFRYIKLIGFRPQEKRLVDFTAIVVHSNMERIGFITTKNDKINQLFNNIIWGQKGNFLDIPTDCPQRDERLGWTGDAQVFIKTATYNYDVEQFFIKWLRDLKADQLENGIIPHVIPNILDDNTAAGEQGSAAWAEACIICPWQLYLSYNNKDILEEMYGGMVRWFDYVKSTGDNVYLWNTGQHFGDWLNLDIVDEDNPRGTDIYLIATAFYAYSAYLLNKIAKLLNKSDNNYLDYYVKIRKAFNDTFVKGDRLTSHTQTAYALVLQFDLVDDKANFSKQLNELISKNGYRLTTGFVGTPYLLHVLSDNGYLETAFKLLLQEEFPSWLYSVNCGATTIWEHWDGIKPDGSMWSKDMNSFNHYAYGAVADWMYEVVSGIKIDEDNPGFKHILLEPHPNKQLGFMTSKLQTRFGKLLSHWEYVGNNIKYRFIVPNDTTATLKLHGDLFELQAGEYEYIYEASE